MNGLEKKLIGRAPRCGGLFFTLLGITAIAGSAAQPAAATVLYKSIHDFNGYPDGIGAYGGLALASDGSYYGVTAGGGKFGVGTIFKVAADGAKLNVYSFPGGSGPGIGTSSLLLGPDGALYGTSAHGGSSGGPSIYRFDITTGKADIVAEIPQAGELSSLILGADGAIYGTAGFNPNFRGGVFRYQIDGGTKFIHLFTAQEGGIFRGADTVTAGTDGYLYGLTDTGGANGQGILYKMNHGGALIKLHDLSTDEGVHTLGAPTITKDNNVWFTTTSSNAVSPTGQFLLRGSIMKIGTNGKGFAVVHPFLLNESSQVAGRLLQAADNRLYGAAGIFSSTIFSIGLDGSYKIIHNLTPAEGTQSQGSLVQGSDGLLYGDTSSSIFRVSIAGQFTTLKIMRALEGLNPVGAPILAPDGNYYVATLAGGTGFGAIYRITPSGVSTAAHNFTGFEGNTHTPLTLGADGKIYGALDNFPSGGSIYRLEANGSITTIVTLNDAILGTLTLGSDGLLYGAGQNSFYAIDPAGSATKLADTSNMGFHLAVLAGNGSVYSVLPDSGDGFGSIYMVKGGKVTVAYHFTSTDGSSPSNLTVGSDGNLYGTATTTIFRYNVTTGVFTVLRDLSTSGNNNLASNIAIKQDGTLYGIDVKDNLNPVLYSLDTNGVFTEQATMPKIDPASVLFAPTLGVTPGDSLIGSTEFSGTHNSGSVFHFVGL